MAELSTVSVVLGILLSFVNLAMAIRVVWRNGKESYALIKVLEAKIEMLQEQLNRLEDRLGRM